MTNTSDDALTTRMHYTAGLTFIELILAMASTAMIGLVIASILSAAHYGSASDKNMRSLIVKQKVIANRLNAAVRSSRMVLHQGDDLLILWMADTRANGAPNLSEIRLIERDDATGELRSYTAPFTLAEVDDTEYQLSDDFPTVLGLLKGTGDFPLAVWATGVTAITITLNDADAQSANLVSYQLTVQAGSMSDRSIGAVSLRNQ